MPPTLDQAGWEIPASSAARLVGVAGPRMKLARRFAAEGAMRTNVVIVSTPSLAFSPSLVEAQEPVGVQALCTELAVERLDEGVVGRLAGTRELERDAADESP